MNRPLLFSAVTIALCATPFLPAQTTDQTIPHKPFQPYAQQAPGAAPDKVWLNITTRVYHCPGDRYYGRTKDGKYMTEPAAKAYGAHGPRGATCFK